MAPFSKILVANRGEIAVRIFRTLRELGIGTVAVYSEADRGRLHVAVADEAYLIGPGPAAESYLRGDRIVEAALRAGAEAIHPGYGFLAENAAFARAGRGGRARLDRPAAGGDRGDGLEDRGARADARRRRPDHPRDDGAGGERRRRARGRGRDRVSRSRSRPRRAAAGRGSRSRRSPDEVERAFETARREGEAYFADPAVYVERYLDDPRHVEVQVLADEPRQRRSTSASATARSSGGIRSSSRRRRPRLSTPSSARGSGGSPSTRRARSATARPARSRVCSTADGSYYFLEMNTRVQVEHTVTEAVTGIDIVREQVRDRRGRAALGRAGRRRPARSRDRVPDQRRGRRRAASCRRRGGSRRTASRRASACASTRACAPGTRSRISTTR